MSTFTITIVGTGVIGTSLGLALKQTDDPPRLVAHDKDLTMANQAAKMGAFDKVEWNLVNACEQADMIVLSIPLNGVKPTLQAIGPHLKQNATLTDTCPSKKTVLDWAKELLPETVHFVGGNPVISAPTGYTNARANLFSGRLYCLTPAATANEEAVQLLTSFVSLLGATPFYLDAAEHDGLTTAIKHLPDMLGVALMQTLTTQNSWREIRKLAGGTFEQVSTGADGDPDGIRDNFIENRQMLLHWLDAYLAQLANLRRLIAIDPTQESAEELANTIDQAVVARTNWLKDYRQGDFIDPDLRAVSGKVEVPGLLERLVGFRSPRKRDKK